MCDTLCPQAAGQGGPIDAAAACRAKESLAVLAADASGTVAAEYGEKVFELPDGKKLTVGPATRAAIAEPLFQPSLVGESSNGLAQLVADSSESETFTSACISVFEQLTIAGPVFVRATVRSRDRDGALESQEHGKDGTDNW